MRLRGDDVIMRRIWNFNNSISTSYLKEYMVWIAYEQSAPDGWPAFISLFKLNIRRQLYIIKNSVCAADYHCRNIDKWKKKFYFYNYDWLKLSRTWQFVLIIIILLNSIPEFNTLSVQKKIWTLGSARVLMEK